MNENERILRSMASDTHQKFNGNEKAAIRWVLEEITTMRKVIKTVRIELAALTPTPANPDWMPALGAGNPADAACLQTAWDAIIGADE